MRTDPNPALGSMLATPPSWLGGGTSLGAPSHRISAKRATTLTNNGEGKMGKKREREREAYEEVDEMRELANKVA